MKYIAQIEPWIGKEEEKAVLAVLRSGWVTEHTKTKEFEEMIADYVGSKYACVVCNGTVSLFIALTALGIEKDDEVIVPDFTMVATPNAVLLTGATPVFVDIDKETLCLNVEQVIQKISKRTKAIVPVSINGRTNNMQQLLKIAQKYHLFVVEDAAQSLGSFFNKKHLGTFGDIGSFSFSTPKIITTGQGGALVTNDKELYEKTIRLKDFGRINRNSQDHDKIGYNFKFTDILAAVGIEQMKKLPWRVKRKKELYKLYKDLLEEVKQIKFISTNLEDVSPWFIDIIVPNPVGLQAYLKMQGIGTRLFYPAIHTTKPYQTQEKFSNSLWVSQHGLWLPSSSFLTDSDIQRVCNEIKIYYA